MSVSTSGGASRTARMAAAYRARATARPDPVCEDRWAAALAGPEAMEWIAAADREIPEMELGVALRTDYLDARVRQWAGVKASHHQVVILGAGLDTRAARLASPGVRFFEVDHPATQASKREMVAALDGYPVSAATYVPCDFEREHLREALARTDFKSAEPAVVLWEGVVPYLTEASARAAFASIAAHMNPRSVLVFDYLGRNLPLSRPGVGRVSDAHEVAKRAGEPFLFMCDDMRPVLLAEGLVRSVSRSMHELAESRLGDPHATARIFSGWHLAEASVLSDPI